MRASTRQFEDHTVTRSPIAGVSLQQWHRGTACASASSNTPSYTSPALMSRETLPDDPLTLQERLDNTTWGKRQLAPMPPMSPMSKTTKRRRPAGPLVPSGAAITRAQLRAELDELLARARIDPRSVKLTFSRTLDRIHAKNRRQHAHINLDRREIEVARAILKLDAPHRLGILAHEVGHLHCDAKFGRAHTEDQVDRCAHEATNVLISYDRSWPGHHHLDPTLRGLQVGTDLTPYDPPRKKSSALLNAEIAEALSRPKPRRR